MWLRVERTAEMTWEVIHRVIHDTSGTFSQGDVTDRPCQCITVGVNGLNASYYQVETITFERMEDVALWLVQQHPKGFVGTRIVDLDREPCPTVQAVGIAGSNRSHYWIEDDGAEESMPADQKPPYAVPSMAEIAALPKNGYNVVSTFSGCGGSCLGFEMEGFTIRWASEFVPAAQDVYRRNHPGVPLNTKDIREVTADDILRESGLAPGEIDVLEGSPPCASFSTAGKRERGWGKVQQYSDTRQRVDDLFFEYVRLIDGLQPKVFVAENVSGLVKGTAKGYFKRILAAMKECGYQVEAKLLDAQWLGVPQARQRIIFVGVRNDLGKAPAFPKPLPYRYSVREALPDIISIEHANGFDGHADYDAGRPMRTVQAGRPVSATVIDPETDMTGYAVGREWDRLAPGEQSDKYFNLVKPDPDKPCPTVTVRGGTVNAASVTHPTQRRKFTIAELKRICAFPDDFVLTGSYAQQWERLGRAVPPVMMRHVARVVRDEILGG